MVKKQMHVTVSLILTTNLGAADAEKNNIGFG